MSKLTIITAIVTFTIVRLINMAQTANEELEYCKAQNIELINKLEKTKNYEN